MRGRALLAIPVTRASPGLAEQVRAAREDGADLIELRVDMIGDVDAVESLLRRPHDTPYVLTVRAAAEGGCWDSSDDERVALIERLGLLGPGYVDVELATWNRSANLRQKIGLVCEIGEKTVANTRARNRLILSHHDFKETPAELDECLRALLAVPRAIGKAVFTASDATDALRVLGMLRGCDSGRDVIALAMGDAGLPTRVLASKFGGFLSFAARDADSGSAPGQPSIGDLRGLYRWETITERTAVYGVIGWPVAHSLSPLMHNAAMAAGDIDGVYLPLPVKADYGSFAAFMDYVCANPWLDIRGLSVTLPHKTHALRWLESGGGTVSALARRCGAVNTLTLEPGGAWAGDNTDADGALAAIATVPGFAASELGGRRVDVLGAGGAARAIVAALCDRGALVTVYNRTPDKAERLAAEFGCAWLPWEQRCAGAGEILVNCTSLGMWPETEGTPLPNDTLCANAVVFDTVYTPRETRLMRAARTSGCRVVAGVEMLLGQAVEQYRMWHGGVVPRAVMSGVLAQHLR
ncbi:MAG: type I 3-dehydroquinate dehydratase [Phycisphaerae bacterium]|nr:type I 3-dehydroquinate dehydratase [Phycisphaerae bacterium]